MKRSHSRRTYPANRAIPIDEVRAEIILIESPNGPWIKRSPTPEVRRWVKKFHIRKSRRYLKGECKEET